MRLKRFLADLALFAVITLVVWPIVYFALVAMAHGDDAALAVEYTVESDAKIEPELNTKATLGALVGMTRMSGYRCDSIAVARTLVWSHGFRLICNGYRYGYEIEDKGGNWIVTLD